MHSSDQFPPVATTADHVRWAGRVFLPGIEYTDDEVEKLIEKYPNTRALRAYFMARPDFVERNKALLRQVLSASLAARRQRAERIEAELADLSKQIQAMSVRSSELNRELVGYLELIASAKEIAVGLRELVRREKALTTELARQRISLSELDKVSDFFGDAAKAPKQNSP